MVRSIIHAGGLSTRFQEAFQGPKALASVEQYPLLWYHMQPLLKSRMISEYVFTLRHKHEEVEKYIGKMKNKFDIKTSSIIEPRPLGRAGSVRLGIEKGIIEIESTYIMSNPDDLIPINIKELVDYAYEVRRKGKAVVLVMAKNTINPFGIGVSRAVGDMVELSHFKEKPELPLIKDHYANTGMMLFLPEAMREFAKCPLDRLTNPEDQIIPKLVKENRAAVFLVERWLPVNYLSEYKKVKDMGKDRILEMLDV